MKKWILGLLYFMFFAVYTEAATRYVDINGANPTSPYTSWGTAATNIQAAVDVADDNDTVLVTDGTYQLSSEIIVNNDVIIKSVNGADLTIVDGGGTNRCFNLGGTACTIIGFTITNGYASGSSPANIGAGIFCGSYIPVVSNCIFVGNTAYLGIGGGLFYGTANNCTFSGNSADYGGGQAGGTANSCIFSNNIATGTETDNTHGNGGGLYLGTANNCLFIGNSAIGDYGNGGGTGGGTANNCLFINNSATGISTNGNGGGMYNGIANNCTFSSNSSTGQGGGMYKGRADNCIAWYNNAVTGNEELHEVMVSYTCSPDATNGVGNITTAPLFVDRQNGNYHLQILSPCIDTGDNSTVVGSYDLDGIIRILNDTVDMGCYEFIAVHYVDKNSVNPQSPYESWATAATDIQAAIDVAVSGTTVLVSDGTYNPVSEVTITNAITIKSVNGAGATVIDGGGTHRCFNLADVSSTIFGFKIINGQTTTIGGGIYAAGKAPQVFNSIISSNSAIGDGGGMYNGMAYNCVFTDNSADSGGGMSQGAVNNCTLVNNSASSNGGGLDYGVATNSILWFNTASGYGDDMYYASLVNSCSPDANGGYVGNITNTPLFVDIANGDLHLQPDSPCINAGDNSCVSGNTDLDGITRIVDGTVDMGAFESVTSHYVYVNGTNPVPPFATFFTAATNIQDAVDVAVPGDIVVIGNGTYYLSEEIMITNPIAVHGYNGSDVTFIDGGGNVRCFNLGTNACVISDVTIQNGYNGGNGGGIYCINNAPLVSGCVVLNNTTAQQGGGMYNGVADNCAFISNTAKNGGGFSGGIVSNTLFRGNSASRGGGGIYYGTADKCIFIGNISSGNGGGMQGSTVNSCVFTKNKADESGGATYLGSVNNCTVTQNSTIDLGGGSFEGAVNNSIVWYNSAGNAGDDLFSGTANYTCSPDVEHAVNGNITNAPLLVSSSHISGISPCRGAGSSLYSVGTDIDGESWHNPPSIGCDEYNASTAGSLELELSVPPLVGKASDIPVVSVVVGATSLFTVDFGDGSAVATNQLFISHAWSTTGLFSVVLTAYNADHAGGISVTQNVDVILKTQYVSTSGSDSNDGWYYLTSKRTIQAAVDACGYGGEVLVSSGTYYPTAEITVSNAINIFGVNGFESTIIDGSNIRRCFNLGAVDCEVSGFTMQNGVAAGKNGGAVFCINRTPYINNCIIKDNNAEGRNGGGIYFGTVVDCIVIANTAKYGGGVAGSEINNCIVRNNLASLGDGGGMYNGIAYNSDFKYNFADNNGGGVYGGEIYSCIFLDNSASVNGGGMSGGMVNGSSFIRNIATGNGGGMYTGIVNNCTFVQNSADNNGGGISGGTANNSIAWYNTAFYDGDDMYGVSANYCCSPDVENGVDGNITDDPLLASASHLHVDSPCVGMGSDIYSFGTDIDGEGWLAPPSIGCDEYGENTYGTPNMFLIMPVQGAVGAPIPVTATVMGAASLSVIDFGDGSTVSNMPQAEHTWDVAGNYTVVLTIFNNDYPTGLASTQFINIIEGIQYVSTTGADANDGLSWSTAKQTVQAAVNAIDAYGGTVFITNGTYSITSEITVSDAIIISSVNGPNVTIIDGGGIDRCFNLGSADCIVSGLTITNGYSSVGNGGGVYCANKTPIISRSILTDNETAGNGGGVYYGTVNDCIFAGNQAGSGGGLAKGVANNCVVTENTATNVGGGIYDASANNSIIYYNFAGNIGDDLFSVTAHYICSADVQNGVGGNITNEPSFINGDAGDYHLDTNSPCLDTGNNLIIASGYGFDGIARPLASVIGGPAVVDMGCYEKININADSDGDTMPDGWENDNGLNPAVDDAADDEDSDWYNNLSEYIAGTDPLDPASLLSVSNSAATNGFVITWNSVTSRTYSVFWTDNLLTNSFQALEVDVNYPRGSYTDTVHAVESTGFYKVEVEKIP